MYSAHLQSIADLLKAALLLEHDREDEKLLPPQSSSKANKSDKRAERMIGSDVFHVRTLWKPQIAVDSVSANCVNVVWGAFPGTKANVEGNDKAKALHPLEHLLSASLGESLSSPKKDVDTPDVAKTDTNVTATPGEDVKSTPDVKPSSSSLQGWRVKDYSLLMTTDGTAVLRQAQLVSVLPAEATSYSFEALDPEKSYRFRLRANLEPINKKLAKTATAVYCESDEVFIGSRVELALEFAADAVGPNLKLDGPLTVRNNTNKKWNTARASSGFRSGIHSWEVSWQ